MFNNLQMNGETNLNILLSSMKPKLNDGEFVFCTLPDLSNINIDETVMIFKEEEALTVILKKETADELGINYSFVAAWITLTVHSSLEAVGLTAAFSKALADKGISCNVAAAYYHDHVFVNTKDAKVAMEILSSFGQS